MTAIALLVGCNPSPYDLAERNDVKISADVRQAIDKYIKDANNIAAEQNGKVYLDAKKFERVIAFIPGSPRDLDPGVAITSYRPSPSNLVTVPKNSVLKEWTDQFALAQEFSYRYSYVETLKIDRQISPPYFTAQVKVLLKISQRSAYAGKPKDIPTAPDGRIAWQHGLVESLGFCGEGGWTPACTRYTGWKDSRVIPANRRHQQIGPGLSTSDITHGERTCDNRSHGLLPPQKVLVFEGSNERKSTRAGKTVMATWAGTITKLLRSQIGLDSSR